MHLNEDTFVADFLGSLLENVTGMDMVIFLVKTFRKELYKEFPKCPPVAIETAVIMFEEALLKSAAEQNIDLNSGLNASIDLSPTAGCPELTSGNEHLLQVIRRTLQRMSDA